MMINRRNFFARSALAAGGVMGAARLGASAEALSAAPGQKPGRIIHMVADGMSHGTLTCADYLSHHLHRRGLAWMALMQQPHVHQGLMNMRSLNSMVTDSAAASSSWASGSRVKNGALNQLPDGRKLTTLYELFGQQGWKRGLVTTTEITHATPAGFAACASSRDAADLIAAQYLERGVDVLLGGGHKFFDPKRRKDRRDLKAEFAAAGYRVMQTAAELAAAPVDRRWLGTFALSHLPFTLDQMQDPQLQKAVPTLAGMTQRALAWLERHDRFILQVEGGRVDHAAHNCDAAAALRDLMAFDDAVQAVLAFQRTHPDTLVVITTDHGNGNMGVNGSGSSYGQSSTMFRKVARVKYSLAEVMRRLRRKPPEIVLAEEDQPEAPAPPAAGNSDSASNAPKNHVPGVKEIQDIVGGATGYKVSDRRAGWLRAYLEKKGTCVYELMNSGVVQLGQLMGNYVAVGWTGNVHTSDYVLVTAVGPGAERFAGFIQNTDVFRHYTQLAGIDFENPRLPLLAESGPAAGDVEPLEEYA